MKLPSLGRGRARGLATVAVTVVALAGSAAAGTAAHAAAPQSSGSDACAQLAGPTKVGTIRGLVRPVSTSKHCASPAGELAGSDPAIGNPPLLYHGGPVMAATGPSRIVVTPIYWRPTGFPMAGGYSTLLSRYLADVAKDSGKHTNVFSTDNQYTGTNGAANYFIKRGAPLVDTHALTSDCTVGASDKKGIYADNTGYKACVSDATVAAEVNSVRTAAGLPSDYKHLYVLFLPKHVESCFNAGGTTTSGNACTINHYPSAAYCAYHSQDTSTGTVYANMPFPIYQSSTQYSCTDENLNGSGTIQSPNGNVDADVEISPTSHEMAEAFTDPDVSTGWYDASGYENGDECAYTYGALGGTAGGFYNQTINTHHYLTQEEFSNKDFALTQGGCLQSE